MLKIVRSDPHAEDPAALARQRIAELHAERAAAIREAERLTATLKRLQEPLDAESAVSAELAALASLEAADARQWAIAAIGEPPALRTKERARLSAKLSEASVAANAARAASQEISAKIGELNRRAAAIPALMQAEMVPILDAEAASLLEELPAVAARHREILARLVALSEVGFEFGRENFTRNEDAARRFSAWASTVAEATKAARPSPPNADDFGAANAHVRALIAQITTGTN
jgi:hypothetical protein